MRLTPFVPAVVLLAIALPSCARDTTMAPPLRRLSADVNASSPKHIAFVSHRGGSPGIYAMLTDGTAVTQLTANAGDGYPEWSPDGTKITFSSNRDGVEHIYVMNADGSGVARLSTEAADESQPSWSSDGKRIAFVSGRDDSNGTSSQIYVMNADGSNPVRVTSLPGVHAHPVWSPDGARIVFWAQAGSNIWITNSDGSGAKQLPLSDPSGSPASWEPGGDRLAVSEDDAAGDNIYLVDVDSAAVGAVRLTSTPGNTYPTWSPDGKVIAFQSNRDGNAEIYVVNTDGSGETRLTNDPATDAEPSWQRTPAAVEDPVTTIDIDPTHAQASVGMSGTFTAKVYDASGVQLTGRLVTWSSSNTTAVTIDSSGFAKAIALGTAIITATSEGKSATATVDVGPYPSPVNDLAVAAITDTAATVTFTQVNDGLGSPASYDVRFAAAPISWGTAPSVSRGTCSTPVGGTAIGTKLSCTVNGLTAGTTYNFQVIAFRDTLNDNAVFGPLSNIAAAASGGAVASVSVSPGGASGTVGQSAQFTATVVAADGSVLSGQPVAWSVTDTTVVSITSTGYATAVGPGSAAIIATAGGKSGRAPVSVASAASGPNRP